MLLFSATTQILHQGVDERENIYVNNTQPRQEARTILTVSVLLNIRVYHQSRSACPARTQWKHNCGEWTISEDAEECEFEIDTVLYRIYVGFLVTSE